MRLGIGFDVDNSNLQRLKQELTDIQQMSLIDFRIKNQNTKATLEELQELQTLARQTSSVLESSYNPKLDTINIVKFNNELKESNLTLDKLRQLGPEAFQQITTALLTTQRETKKVYSIVDKLGETFINTVKWTISSGVLNTITGSIQKMWNYTQKLDNSLNDIRIVTGKSADEMDRFARKANAAAKTLGASTTAYTNASLIYYQQGLSDEDVKARTEVTVKAANVTGQSAAEVSDQLTAVWNGYRVVAKEAELYVDKLAAVAATTAADLEELSEGMSKVASAANTMGVDVDQLSAQLATIVSVTREDASAVGTALKTIYARMGDLSVDGVDEFGVSLGDVSGQMKQMGIDVLDQNENLRDMGAVMEEVAAKWNKWTDAQKQAAAVAMAGKRQYNNLMALFENWDMYESALSTSKNSKGTLQAQQDIYTESLEAHLTELSTAGEKFYDAFMDSDSMKGLIDGLSKIVELGAQFTEAIGGGGTALMLLSGVITKKVGPEIGDFLSTLVYNHKVAAQTAQEEQAELEVLQQLESYDYKLSEQNIKKVIELKKKQLKYEKDITEEQRAQNQEQLRQYSKALSNQENAKAILGELADKFVQIQGSKDTLKRTRKRIRSSDLGQEVQGNSEEAHLLNEINVAESAETEANTNYDKQVQIFEQLVKEHKDDLDAYHAKLEALVKTGDNEQKDQAQKELDILDKKNLEAAQAERDRAAKERERAQTNYDSHYVTIDSAYSQASNQASFSSALAIMAQQTGEGAQAKLDMTKKREAYDQKYGTKGIPIDQLEDSFNVQKQKVENLKTEIEQLKALLLKQTESGDTAGAAETQAQITDKETALKTSPTEKDFSKQQKDLADVAKAYDNARGKMASYNAVAKEFAQKTKDITKSEESKMQITQKASNRIIELQKATRGLGSILTKLVNDESLSEDEMRTLVKACKAYQEIAEDSAKASGELADELNKVAQDGKQAGDSIKGIETKTDLDAAVNRTKKITQSATEAIGVITTLVGAIQTLSNIGDIINNDDLSDGEKALQIILAIVGVLGAVISIIPTLQAGIGALKIAITTLGNKGAEAGTKIAISFWPLLVITLAIIAAIAIIVIMFKVFHKESKSATQVATEGLQDMQEAAENAKEAVEELKDEYEDLKKELDSYKDAKLALEDMREGTEEWTEAVAELNQQVLDLVEQYPELAQYMTVDSSGVLGLSQEGQDELLKAQQKKIIAATTDARATALMSKIAEGNLLRAEIKEGGGFDTKAEQKAFNSIYSKYNKDNRLFANISDETYDKLAEAYWSKKEYNIKNASINADTQGIGIDKELLTALTANIPDNKRLDLIYDSQEDLAKALKDQAAELQENFTALNANTAAIEALSYNYLYQLALEKGISDPETYAARGKTWKGQEDALAAKAENYTTNNTENYWKKNLKDYYDGSNEDDNINDFLKQQLSEYYGDNATYTFKVDSIGNDAGEFEDAVIGTVNGKEITGKDLIEKYYTGAVESDTEQNNEALAKKIKAYSAVGYNTKAAFFYNYGDDEFSATSADSKGNFTRNILGGLKFLDADEADTAAKTNWTKYQEHFKEEAEKYINTTAYGIGYDSAGFNNFTLNDFKNYALIRRNATSTGGDAQQAISALYNRYSGDETKTLAINNALAAVTDWTDASQWLTVQSTLAKAGVIIDENDTAWTKFMKDMTDGAKQWVKNSNSVIENLATIKKLTESISFGDILEEEDYKKLINLAPELEKLFIAAAGGYKALATSDELNKVLKKSYNSLTDIKKLYGEVTDIVEGKTVASSTTLDTAEGVKGFMQEYINNISDNAALWKYANVDSTTLESNWKILNDNTIDTSSAEYTAAYNSIKAVAQSINQAITDAKNGNLSSQAAQEYWVTSIAESWSDVLAQKESGNLDDEVYTKAKTMFAGEMLSELGFSTAMADAWDPTELEKHVRAFRALELNYVEDLEQKIEALGQEIEAAFGKEKINLLGQKAQTTAEEAARSNSYAIAVRAALFARSGEDNTNLVETTLQEAGVQDVSYYYDAENNEVDTQALSSLLLRLDPESAAYTSVQNLINWLDKAAEAENEASQLWWDVIDLQIEAYDEQIDLIDKIREAAEEWREFERSFKDYDTGKLSVFDEQGAAATIKNAFEDYDSQVEGFQTTLGRLEDVNIEQIEEDAKNLQSNLQDDIKAKRKLEESRENTQSSLAAQEKIVTDKKAQNAELEKENSSLIDQNSSLADQNSSLQTKIDDLNIDTLESNKDAKEAALESVRESSSANQHKTALQNVWNTTGAPNALVGLGINLGRIVTTGVGALVNKNADKEAEAKALKESEEATNAYDDAVASQNEYNAAIKANTTVINTNNGKIAQNNETIKTNKEDIDEANEAISEFESQLSDTSKEIATVEDRIKTTISEAESNPFYTIDTNTGNIDVQYSQIEEHWEEFLSTGKEQLEEMQATLQSLYEGYLDAQSELMELYDTEIEKLSTINSILSSSADLWKIVGKNATNSANTISQIYNTITSNVGSQFELAVVKQQVAQAEYDKYLEQMALDENNRSKDIEDTLLNNLSTATTDMLAYASEYLTSLADSFQATMSATVDDFIKGTTGMGLEETLEDWTLYQAQEDQYLDSVNKEYGLSSLEQKFQKSIDATDSVTAQKKLNDVLRQQLSYLREKDKLSQYDLDRANAMYELTLKQIALEEAQQTANKLKMVRDASGNYTYQFVADQDQIAQAEEELEAAQNNLYNLDKDRNETLVTDYYNAYSEANEKIYAALAAGDTERAQRLEEYYFGANGLLSGIKRELGYAEQNLESFKDIIGNDNFASDLKKYTAAITGSDFGSLAQNMKTLVDQVAGEDGTMTRFVETIDDMLTSSSMASALNTLSSSLLTAAEIEEETTELMSATDAVLKNLSLLTKEVGGLSELLLANAEKYQEWLESQTDTSEMAKNTTALENNRKATEDLTTLLSGIKIEGGTISIPENQTNS